MSTMKVTNLKHESSSVNNIVLNSDGSVGGELATTLASKLDLAGGKILQIVRATDSTQRSTTSTSFVDVTGMSVTITPQKSDSAIIVISSVYYNISRSTDGIIDARLQITDSSNNAVSGSENGSLVLKNGLEREGMQILIGYATPATTSAVTYKVRFRVGNGTLLARNDSSTGQMYAIEVSA